MKSAIRIRGVTKKYELYRSAQHRLLEALHPFKRKYHEEFWALRDVNLDIAQGEIVGILGVNGSGKSTLLQIICSIIQPTTGSIEVSGKVAALLELGAGFNPNLTGRENVEMNCTILGMNAEEIRASMPLIEAFADIGEFFDQPVKIYSSGMFMRVAFSAAIHTDPDILVIDEALAVGDARFRQKCSRKFDEFRERGKTIILVTHDRHAVPRLCTHAIMLNAGSVVASGDPKEVTEKYGKFLQVGQENDEGLMEPIAEQSPLQAKRAQVTDRALDLCPMNPYYNKSEFRYGQGGAAIIGFDLATSNGGHPDSFLMDELLFLSITVRYDRQVEEPNIGYSIQSPAGVLTASISSKWLGVSLGRKDKNDTAVYKFACKLHLTPGDWFVNLTIASDLTTILDTREALAHLRIRSTHPSGGLVSLESRIYEVA